MVEDVEDSTTEVGVEAITKDPRDTVEVDMAEMDRGWVKEDLVVIMETEDLESEAMLGGEEYIMEVKTRTVDKEVTGCRGDSVETKMIDEVLKIGEEVM